LQNHGVRCWFAPHDLKIGDKIRSRIDESIRLYDKLLLVLSEHSVASQWVEQEVETALEKEHKEQRTVLFPIRLDNTIMETNGGWPALIRNTRNIGDFTCWKDYDAYQKGFERLLRDLKAESGQRGAEVW
jgi:TIR domain